MDPEEKLDQLEPPEEMGSLEELESTDTLDLLVPPETTERLESLETTDLRDTLDFLERTLDTVPALPERTLSEQMDQSPPLLPISSLLLRTLDIQPLLLPQLVVITITRK